MIQLIIHALALRERGDVMRAQIGKFYNLSWRYLTQTVTDHHGNLRTLDGTLYFDDDANLFDRILYRCADCSPVQVT